MPPVTTFTSTGIILMTIPSYDQTSPSSIEKFGKRLLGSTLRKTPGVREIPQEYLEETPGVQTKGYFGTIIEKYYYGIDPGNQPCSPDFKEAGVELKTNALETRKKGMSAKERLVFQMIDYDGIIHESFETSCFMVKSRLMMLISNMFQRDRNLVDAVIRIASLLDFDKLPITDQQIIREDWTTIAEKVRRGQAHQLSGSDTTYLEACTKGVDSAQRVPQPIGNELAKPRAFALKSGYVTSLVRGYLKDDLGHLENDEQLAITDASEIETKGFEATIIERFAPFLGLGIDDIEARLGVGLNQQSKSFRAILALEIAKLIMGVTTRKIAEFERAGITIKTMLVNESGLPNQHMSFPAFRYMGEGSVMTEEWDAVEGDSEEFEVAVVGHEMPKFKRILEEQKFLFVVFKNDGETQTLHNVMFWSMAKDDIESFVRPVWQQTRDAISTGMLEMLPKTSFNHVCHVRPHGRNAADTLPTPRNGEQPKKSFWLDRRYIQAQILLASNDSR